MGGRDQGALGGCSLGGHEARAIEPDRVLQRGDFGGVGVGSSIETLASYTLVYTIRDSLIARVDYFSDHAEALKAVGLAAE